MATTTRPLSFEQYKKLLAEYQRAAIFPFLTQVSWGASENSPDPTPLDPSVTAAQQKAATDFWAKYSPEVKADFQRHMADSRDWGDTVGSVLKVAVPALVGGAGLAATGLFGAGLQSAVGGAALGETAVAGTASTLSAAGAGEVSSALTALEAGGAITPAEWSAATQALSNGSFWEGLTIPAAANSTGTLTAIEAGLSQVPGLSNSAIKAIAKAVGGSLSSGSGGSGSAFRNTLSAPTDTQEDLNDDLAEWMTDQTEFNREQFDYYKDLSTDQYNLGREAFEWNKGLADEARDRATRYDDLYFSTTGKQLKAFSDAADAYDSPAEGLRMSGRAIADVESQMDNARGAYTRGLTSRGWNPNSAALQSSLGDMELQGALAKSGASTMAFEAAKREGLNLRAMAAGLGQANANVATANTGLSGELTTSGLNASTQAMQPSFTNLGLYNQGQNTAINWGNAANSGFNSMRTGNSSWSDNLNYGRAILGGLTGFANGGIPGAIAGGAGGLLSGW